MIKLFKPFQPKIGLCRNTGFLRNLWDKYVPKTSENYGRISLIYLHGGQGDEPKPKQQAELLISLVLKNIFVQMNLSQNPTLLNQTAISRSVKQMRKIYLQQLRKIDFGLYQSLNQYAAHLEQAQREEIRYREWTKENRLITRMQREYQALQGLSVRLKEMSEVWLAGQERRYGKILFRSFDKKEYKILSEAFLWAQKQQVEEFIRNCSEGQYEHILTRMEKDPALYLPPGEVRSVEKADLFLKKDKKELYQQFELMEGKESHRVWEETPEKQQTAEFVRHCSENPYRNTFIQMEKEPESYPLPEEVHRTKDVQHERNMGDSLGEEVRRTKDVQHERNMEDILGKEVRRTKDIQHERNMGDSLGEEVRRTKDVQHGMPFGYTLLDDRTHRIPGDSPQKREQDLQKADLYGTESGRKERDIQKPTQREWLVSLVQSFGHTKFRQFCQQAVSEEMKTDVTYRGLLQTGLFWKKDKKEVYQQFELMNEMEIHRFWKEIPLITAQVCRIQEELQQGGQDIRQEERFRVCRKFSERLEKVQKKYRKEIRKYVQDTVLHIENPDEYEMIQNAVDIPAMLGTDNIPVFTLSDKTRPSHRDMKDNMPLETEEYIFAGHIQGVRQSLKEQLEVRARRMVQRERQVLERYTEIYRDILPEEDFNIDRNLYLASDQDSEYGFVTSIEIEKIFRQKHEKEELSKTLTEKLKRWSEVLLNLSQEKRKKTTVMNAEPGYIDTSSGEKESGQTERMPQDTELFRQHIQTSGDRADFQRLTAELTYYIEIEETEGLLRSDAEDAETVKGGKEDAILVYREDQVYHPQIQELLQHFRQTKEEERQEFIRQLADMLIIQRRAMQEDIFVRKHGEPFRVIKQSADDVTGESVLEGQDAAWENPSPEWFRQEPIQMDPAEERFGRMQEWGRALLYHPVPKSDENEEELSVVLQEGTGGLTKEELRTQVIRHQIEKAKHRTELQRVLQQINHRLEDTGFQMEYHKGQLQDSSILKMVSWLGELEGTQYQEAVSQLADVVRMLRVREQKPDFGERMDPVDLKHLRGRESVQGNNKTESMPESGEPYSFAPHAMYPELARRIQQYEVQREKTRAAEAGRMRMIYTEILEPGLHSEEEGMPEEDPMRLLSAYAGYRGRQDITYVFSEEFLSGRKQKNRSDAQKEAMQVKSLRQMDMRLREIEKQLQKKADARQANGVEDIRSIAEKVKKQLHEELHMERLRRGMV